MVKRYIVDLNSTEGDEDKASESRRKMNDRNNHYSRNKRHRPTNAAAVSAAVDTKSRRVFVGNLAWDVSWQDLKDHLRSTGVGEVTHVEILKNPEGRSKGCAIATFASAQQALDVTQALNGSDLKGRPIFIREDREQGDGASSHPTLVPPMSNPHPITASGTGNLSVFVGNLLYETSWQNLKDHMRLAGNVDFVKILTHEDGTSKGCALVKYQKPAEVVRAIRELNNSDLDGRFITVREDQGYNTHDNSVGGGNDPDVAAVCQLYVGNISYDSTWRDLKDLFRECGDVEHVEVMEFPNGKKRGFATVKFYHARDAQKAMDQFNGIEFQGRILDVRFDTHVKPPTAPATSMNGHDATLFVGNLSYDTSWQDLKDFFRPCGSVEHVEVMEFPDGRKKGFGTVKFSSSPDAQAAIDQLNGSELHGRILEVRWDQKVSSRKLESRERSTYEPGPKRQLFIANLAYETKWNDLKELFQEIGDVERADIMTFPDGRSKGVGTVRFAHADDANAAISRFHGVEFQGRILEVKLDEKA